MNRGRSTRDSNSRNPSGIPQTKGHQRSSSMDIMSRGSYLPPNRRSASLERKPLLRTTPLKSSFGNSLTRGSSLGKKTLTKDPRPLSDRAYQKQCINKLVDYLEDNQFPFAISKTNLLLPSKKDFGSVFQFLYSFWDPKYEVQKIEDEVPKIMKSFNYPFTIARSALMSITRLSWPTLLGVLMWLVDLNRCYSSVCMENYFSTADFESTDEQNILVNYICQSYETQIADSANDEVVFTNLARKKVCSDIDVEELLLQNQELEERIEKEMEEQESFRKRIEYKKEIESDIVNHQGYIEKMNEHMKSKISVYEKIKETNMRKEDELKELQNEAARLEAIYKSQGFDGEQAQHFFHAQKENLMQKLQQKREQLKTEEKEFWDLEIELSQLTDKAETRCMEFCRTWERLRNTADCVLDSVLKNTQVPAARKLLRDHKLNIPDVKFHPRFAEDLKPLLERSKKYIDEERRQIQNIVLTQENHIHQMNMKIADMAMQHELLLAQLKQKEREMEIKAKDDLQKLEDLKLKSQSLDEQILHVYNERRKCEDLVESLKKSMDEINNKIEEKEQELQHHMKEASNLTDIEKAIMVSYNKLESLKDNMMSEIDEFVKFMKENPL